MKSRRNPKSRITFLRLVAWALGLFVWAAMSIAQEGRGTAKLTFTKVLEGSTPEFMEIAVDSTGAGTYEGRKRSDPPSARPLQLSPGTTQRLFALAHEMNNFKSIDLESHKNVANLGHKTFTYEWDGQKNSAEFNYSLRRDAQELADIFEKISSVEEHIKSLEFATKYDHLSLPRELLQIEIELNNQALADPPLMVPTLEQIAHEPRFLHLAQVRAQDILDRVRESN
jgi:hypothetical protein